MTAAIRRWIAVAGLIAALSGATFYTLRLRMAESLYPKRGSIAWWIAVSSTVRNMPTPGLSGEPTYYTSAGDGPKPPQDEVVFRSTAPAAAIREQVREFLLRRGYKDEPVPGPNTDGAVAFRNAAEQSAVYLTIRGAEVTITQYQ